MLLWEGLAALEAPCSLALIEYRTDGMRGSRAYGSGPRWLLLFEVGALLLV